MLQKASKRDIQGSRKKKNRLTTIYVRSVLK